MGAIKFFRAQFQEIQRHARQRSAPDGHEVCGLILDNGFFFELIEVQNKTKRGGGFSFYVREVRSICRFARICGHEVVGTFHSHPVGLAKPSASDIRNAVDDSVMLIYDVLGRSAMLWRIKGGKAVRLKFQLI